LASTYRLYRLDGSGKIRTGEWINAATDEDAVRAAHAQAGEGDYELWAGRRLVARIRKEP